MPIAPHVEIRTKKTAVAIAKVIAQRPYALSRAINDVVLEAKAEIIRDLPKHFTIRRKWVEKGVQVRLSRKDNLVASVLSKDDFMARQEYGGEKTPKSGKAVAIPLAARPTPESVTPQSKWPSKLPRRFLMTLPGGKELVVQRRGKKKGRKPYGPRPETPKRQPGARPKDKNLWLMYALKPRVHVRARWGFETTVRDVVRRSMGARYAVRLADALRTAR